MRVIPQFRPHGSIPISAGSSISQTAIQQLKAAQKLVTKLPLFIEQLASELPELTAHVAEHVSCDMITEPLAFPVGKPVTMCGAS